MISLSPNDHEIIFSLRTRTIFTDESDALKTTVINAYPYHKLYMKYILRIRHINGLISIMHNNIITISTY